MNPVTTAIPLVAIMFIQLAGIGSLSALQATPDSATCGDDGLPKFANTVVLPTLSAMGSRIHVPDGGRVIIGGKRHPNGPATPPVAPASRPVWRNDDSAYLVSRQQSAGMVQYGFQIGTHTMQVRVDDSGELKVVVHYVFSNEESIAEFFPELQMDFGNFPATTNNGSSVQLSVHVNSEFDFVDDKEFEEKLPRLYLHYDVLKNSEPQVETPRLILGGVIPRIIIQEEEEAAPVIPLQVIEPALKKDGG